MLGKLRVTDPTLAVLDVLLGPDDQLWGLKIAHKVGRPTGSVFPILARLEQKGWVVSEWETSEARGARRRFYQLTPEGVDGARALLAERGRPTGRVRSRSGSLRPRVEGAG
ncbi:MAG TPA: helix-turn-helix transcriptional regulator [Pseudonocardiaceae bacterium]|nr:helix-turn-helix transcriptional regulator [Pseudonocardiaceae bacterium]